MPLALRGSDVRITEPQMGFDTPWLLRFPYGAHSVPPHQVGTFPSREEQVLSDSTAWFTKRQPRGEGAGLVNEYLLNNWIPTAARLESTIYAR